MIENKDNENSGTKRQMRKGGLFTNRNKRVKNGLMIIKAIDTEEINFKTTADVGFDGQFAVEDNPFNQPVPAPAGVSNKSVVFTDIGINQTLAMRASIIPVENNFYRSGTTGFAWAGVYAHAFPAPSDRRLKDSIKEIKYGLNTINKLNPVSFIYKSDLKRKVRLGLIAQEAKEVIPEIIHGSEQEKYAISYDELVPILIKAVQELSIKVEKLQKDK